MPYALSKFLSYLLLCLILLFVFAWAYKYIFCQNLIETYSVGKNIPKRQINEHIRRNFNAMYGTKLVEVSIEDADDDEYTNVGKPARIEANSNKFSSIIGVVFSLTFAMSIELIILMMCELVDVFDEYVRLVCFQITINTLVFLLTCVQPFMVISLCFNEELIPLSQSNLKRTGTVLLYLGWFFILHKCGDLSQSFTPDKNSFAAKTLIERKINEISIAGITIMAILSGVGSTSTPYKVFSLEWILSYFTKSRIYTAPKAGVTETDINNFIQSYNHTCSLITKRKHELNSLLVANGGTVYNMPNSSTDNFLLYHPHMSGSPKKNKLGGLLHKVQSFASISSLSLDKEKLEEKELQSEIDSLVSLRLHIYNDLVKALFKFSNNREQLHNRSKKWVKAMSVFNVAFAGYCVYRIVNVFFIKQLLLLFDHMKSKGSDSIIDEYQDKNTANTKDALAITISKLIISMTQLSVSETQLVNQISLVLSGSLFVCSFSNVLKTFQSFSKLFPSITKISPTTKDWLKNLVITELLGIYVISTAILIRTNLPANLSNQISRVLSLTGSSASNTMLTPAKEVKFIDDWFDKVFGIACASTLVVFTIKRFMDDDNFYDEELMVEDSTTYKAA